MYLRNAVPDDADELAKIFAHTWRSFYSGLLPDIVLDHVIENRPTQWWAEKLAHLGVEHAVVVQANDGMLDGFIFFGPSPGVVPGFDAEIYEFYVARLRDIQLENQARQALVQHATETMIAQGAQSMLAWAVDGGIRSRLYMDLGGEQIDIRYREIGLFHLREVAYGWQDIRMLMAAANRNPNTNS